MSLETVVLILAGGRGTRLWPLTAERNKPAVPIAGKYRLIDIPVSNAINSGYDKIFALTQGMDYSFSSHLQRAWTTEFFQVQIVSPQNVKGDFTGNADAVRQMMNTVEKYNPGIVFVASGDHVLKMNYNIMVKELLESKEEAIISLYIEPVSRAGDLGAVCMDSSGMVTKLEEKNLNTKLRVPEKENHFYASMGIYAFKIQALLKAFANVKGDDFALDIIPYFIEKGTLRGYSFSKNNRIPGFVVNKSGKEEAVSNIPDSQYWEDLGDIDKYFKFHLALLGGNPEFSFSSPISRYNQQNKQDWWPIRTETRTEIVPPVFSSSTLVADSIVNEGVNLNNVNAKKVIFAPSVYSRQSIFENCIIGEGAIIMNSNLTNVIVDKLAIVKGLKLGPNFIPENVIQHSNQGTLYKTKGGIIFRDPTGIFVIPKYYGTSNFSEKLYRSIPNIS